MSKKNNVITIYFEGNWLLAAPPWDILQNARFLIQNVYNYVW